MKIELRFPGGLEYSYASLVTTEGSPQDNARELRDVDDNLLTLIGNLLSKGCALVAAGPLQPQVINQMPADSAPYTPDTPPWAQQPQQAPQEAQGYSYPPQGYQAPQGAPQGQPEAYQGSYAGAVQQSAQYNQQPAPQYAPQPQAGPPGMQAPMCQHNVPRKYKAPFTSKAGRECSASWQCQANVPQNQQCSVEWIKG